MEKDIIKITKPEIMANDEYSKRLEKQNMKLIALRKKHVYSILKDATIRRIETSKNIASWIKMLADKIFNPESIAEMDLNKAISLFKYVNNINLKVLSESNRLEEVLSKYIESGAMDTQNINMDGNPTDEREKIKSEILSKLNRMFKENIETTEDAIFVPESESLSKQEEAELEAAEKELNENLMDIDKEELEELEDLEEKKKTKRKKCVKNAHKKTGDVAP